jgi:acetolactate synthase I/II/III large subunit
MTSVSNSRQTTVMTGSDIVVKSLVDHGVEVIFAYPVAAACLCTSR